MKYKLTALIALTLSCFSGFAAATPPSINTPQAANTVLAGPTTGGNALSSYRTLTAKDIGAGSVGTNQQALVTNGTTSTWGTVGPFGGGTGLTNITNHGVMIGQDTSPVVTITGFSGQVLTGSGTGSTDPIFTYTPTFGASGHGGSITLQGSGSGSGIIGVSSAAGIATLFQIPNTTGTNGQFLSTDGSGHTTWGTLAGDITGTIGSNTVAKLQGFGLNTIAASGTVDGAYLVYSGDAGAYVPQLIGSTSGPSDLSINSGGQGVVTGATNLTSDVVISQAATVRITGNYFGDAYIFSSSGRMGVFCSNAQLEVGQGGLGEFQDTNGFVGFGVAATGIEKMANISTQGLGAPAIYGFGRKAAQTAACISTGGSPNPVTTYTNIATDGSFLVTCNVLITTATLHNFTVTCEYTDEGNTARTATFTLNNLAGTPLTAITNTGGAVPYEGLPMHIRCKASTSIKICTAGTFTTVVYNVEGSIMQIK